MGIKNREEGVRGQGLWVQGSGLWGLGGYSIGVRRCLEPVSLVEQPEVHVR